jgi:hypothetical protein
MQYRSGYPIDELLDFLDPAFPGRFDYRKGFGAVISGGKREAAAAQEELIVLLEEWIRTGFQPDGSETPEERNFTPKQNYDAPRFELYPAPNALNAVADYLGGKLLAITEKTGKVSYAIYCAGGFAVDVDPKGGMEYRPSTGHLNEPRSIAASVFAEFYRSDCRFRLMKCKRCGKFDVLDKPRKSYVRGWHCSKACSDADFATKNNKANRDAHQNRWFPLAVEAYADLDAMAEKPDEKPVVWIAKKINEQLRKIRDAATISRNTITHNFQKIEEAARERIMPKAKERDGMLQEKGGKR